MAGGYVTLNQLLATVTGRERGNTYQRKSWVPGEPRALPVHRKKVRPCSFPVVYLEEFWKWAEAQPQFPRLLENGAAGTRLGSRRGSQSSAKRITAPARSSARIRGRQTRTVALKCCSVSTNIHGRSCQRCCTAQTGAIQHRCRNLGIKDRPVKADNHGKSARCWNEQRDYAVLADGIRHGDSYMAIGQALGKSEKAVRGKVYTVYLTENADKVREYMGDGPWGAGAPEPKVKQAGAFVHYKDGGAKAAVISGQGCCGNGRMIWATIRIGSVLCASTGTTSAAALPAARIAMTAQGSGVSVRGVVLRCGGTFYERKENRFCGACRTARKKKAQRHWCRVNHS